LVIRGQGSTLECRRSRRQEDSSRTSILLLSLLPLPSKRFFFTIHFFDRGPIEYIGHGIGKDVATSVRAIYICIQVNNQTLN
jgi:hypothetical protein